MPRDVQILKFRSCINESGVAFVKSFRTVDTINLTGAWLNPDTETHFGINERCQAVVENQGLQVKVILGRSQHLKLPTLKYRRTRGDMIEVYKILHNKAVIDLYEPVSDSILKPDLVSWYK